MKALVIEPGKEVNRKNPITTLIAMVVIWFGLIPIAIMDVYINVYQIIYFGIQGIPMVKRSDYLIIDRWKLSKLTGAQKMSCLYCEYANGMAAWFKAVANQTEAYSCAIKHKYPTRGQEHQHTFAEYQEYS